jgi:N-dimethylarginine dimethylaminohydrolase
MTAHSEVGTLKMIFLKHIKDAFINDDKIDKEWQDLNYTARPDLAKALSEYAAFESFIKKTGATIHYMPQNNAVSLDALYCRDAAIATNGGMILCNMGKMQRNTEPAMHEKAFKAHHIPIWGAIKSPGTLEGGDVAWLDEKSLAVGHTYRTNDKGIQQLRGLLKPLGVKVYSYSLPHYKGKSDVFHLMSIFSPVDRDLAVVYSPLMPINFRNDLLKRGYRLVEVPAEEFEMACNVLALSPRRCLMLKGYPKTKAALEVAGCTVFDYSGDEISVKGGGGPTCLTRPIFREL